jgi:hypothetical protein
MTLSGLEPGVDLPMQWIQYELENNDIEIPTKIRRAETGDGDIMRIEAKSLVNG